MMEGKEGRHVLDLAGTRTQVWVRGEGGVPLVLLHGVLSDGASWDPVAVELARHRMVVAPDMPLHGGTEAPPDFDMGPGGMVEWTEALLDALGAETADICGLSMGGAVAIHFAAERPDRVRRLVLVDAANVVPLADPYGGFLGEMREKLEDAIGAGVVASRECWTMDMALGGEGEAAVPLCTDPLIMSVLEYLEGREIPFSQVLRGLELLDTAGAGALSRITAPTLAIWGREDPFFHAEEAASALEGSVPDVRVRLLEAGHNPVTEGPEAFLEEVEGFLG